MHTTGVLSGPDPEGSNDPILLVRVRTNASDGSSAHSAVGLPSVGPRRVPRSAPGLGEAVAAAPRVRESD